MRGVRGAAPLAVALAALVVVTVFLGFSDTLNPLDALLGRGAVRSIPDVVKRPRPGAEAALRAAGFRSEVRTTFSLTAARGTVIRQDPAAGARRRTGATVELLVSRGANRVTMPDGVGRPEAEVRGPLEAAGVTVQVERRASEQAAAGLVLEQEPGAGVELTGRDRVRLVVSDGPLPRPVPDVAGLAVPGASFRLGEAGLDVSEVVSIDDAAPVGAVVRTDPPAGSVVARDTPVRVLVSAGPPPVAVPELVAVEGGAAAEQLRGLGLVPNVVLGDAAPPPAPTTSAAPAAGSVPPTTPPLVRGAVYAQEPATGAQLRPGSVVTLQVAR
ncbi:MAG: PASTA domain-containing protein [Microthrixaceae bacterium]